MARTSSLLACALACTLILGCGDGGSKSGAGSGGGVAGQGTAKPRTVAARVKVEDGVHAESDVGVIVGVVRFEGQAPRRLHTVGCADHESTPLIEDYVIQDGKVANVVVSVRRMPSGYVAPAPPKTPHLLDQHGCLYVPHVSAVQTGHKVQVDNSDSTAHNVHVFAKLNESPNVTIGAGGRPIDLDFEKAEVVRFACDIHPWMGAYIKVLVHPFFAVTGEDGTFRLEGLPPGEYEFEAWHEKLGKLRTKSFTLKAGGEARVEFSYER